MLEKFGNDWRVLETAMCRHLNSEIALISEIGIRQLTGGKKLRALISLLSGRLCGLPQEQSEKMASAVEFIHAATLLHDDVVDEADTRRRQDTTNRVYGNAAAVLVGDFLYSRASQIFSDIGNLRLLSRVADATNQLSEGEVLQLIQRGNPETAEEIYFSIIERKTANLFEIAAAGPAILTENTEREKYLSEFGRHLGIAFQLVDDCLDYEGEDTGKNIGRDFAEGKMTLPVILAFASADLTKRKALMSEWRAGGGFADILRLLRETGALGETRQRAKQEIGFALQALKQCLACEARESLIMLASLSVDRRE
ncbi:MAG: polyprenyl synthetase family protein [Candidatus Zeuxoniibacter abyssi]|nr:MAG: polyprenyl synthetase family protein [Candidatus Persebacteraceae bacterium AB1(2)]